MGDICAATEFGSIIEVGSLRVRVPEPLICSIQDPADSGTSLADRLPEDLVPTYQYACTECDHRFEAVQAFTEDSLTTCPVCGGQLRKVYGSVGVVFKGSGFYRTDSRAAASGTGSTNGSAEKPASGDKSGGGDKTGGEKKAAASSGGSDGSSSGSKAGAASSTRGSSSGVSSSGGSSSGGSNSGTSTSGSSNGGSRGGNRAAAG